MTKTIIGMVLLFVSGIVCEAAVAQQTAAQQTVFSHPGILHTAKNLQRIASRIVAKNELALRSFEELSKHPQSRADYRMRGPVVIVNRPGRGNGELALDANAAYQNALMYCFSGEEKHAQKSIEILKAWSAELKEIRGHDAPLAAGLYGFKLVAAAELLRWQYDNWPVELTAKTETMFLEVFLPVVNDFATYANGNWDGACMKTVMAIGIYSDRQDLFDRAAEYYRKGKGNGAITNYVINQAGQCQESGRDQQHTQLGLGQLATCCEMAWHQKVDLYAVAGNRLLQGFEYTAKYNLGKEVPFEHHVDTTGKYRHAEISDESRGRFRPIYEMVWNHYHSRCGLSMPNTEEVIEKTRPEGPAFHTDHVGFGTLLFGVH